MKWFKHLSEAPDDEKLAEVLDEHGAGGYGVWWLIVEAVARQMDKTTKCDVRYSFKKWVRITHVDRRTLAKYLQTFDNLALIVLQNCDKFVTISIPKLRDLRDNHTNNLQVTTPPACKQEVEVEVEEPLVKKFSEDDTRCAVWIFDLIKQLDGKRKEPNFDAWSDTIRLMRERDELTHREIAEVFKWANDDHFWKTNILSPQKLREQFSTLRIKMANPKDNAEGKPGYNPEQHGYA